MRFEEVVNKSYDKLNENDRYILKIICADKPACRNLPIHELAERCNVSRTTILRFAQKLGFSGYAEFKVFLNWENEAKEEPSRDCVQRLYEDIAVMRQGMDAAEMKAVCRMLLQAKRVFVYGTGAAQQDVAKEVQRTFMAVHKYLHIIEGETELQNAVGDMCADDVLLLISYSGSKLFLRDIVHQLQMNNVSYISLTNFTHNFLAQHAKYSLYIPATPFNLPNGERFNSTVLLFLLVDILFREYVQLLDELTAEPSF